MVPNMALVDKLFVFLLLGLNVISASLVKLTGPPHVYTNDQFWIFCNSDTIPQEQTAEFVIGEKTIDTIRYFDDACFSTLDGGFCNKERCRCFAEGRSYHLSMAAQSFAGKMTIGCSMKIHVNDKPVFQNDLLTIQVLDSSAKDTTTKESKFDFQTLENTTQTKSSGEPTTRRHITGPSDEKGEINTMNMMNVIFTGSVIVGLLLLVTITSIAVCTCRKRLSCNRSNNKLSSAPSTSVNNNALELGHEENGMNDPDYQSINESQLIDIETRATTHATVTPSVGRPNTEFEALYLEVLPDIECRNSYESLCKSDGEDDYHHYLSCPTTNGEYTKNKKSSEKISATSNKLYWREGDQQIAREINKNERFSQSKLKTI